MQNGKLCFFLTLGGVVLRSFSVVAETPFNCCKKMHQLMIWWGLSAIVSSKSSVETTLQFYEISNLIFQTAVTNFSTSTGKILENLVRLRIKKKTKSVKSVKRKLAKGNNSVLWSQRPMSLVMIETQRKVRLKAVYYNTNNRVTLIQLTWKITNLTCGWTS